MLFLAGNTNKARSSMQYLQGSKKRDGGSNRNLSERRTRKRNHAFGNESIKVRPPFIISSCTAYISWLFGMSAKCVGNLSRTIDRVSTKSQKEHCNSFSLGKGGRAQWFLNLPQMRVTSWLVSADDFSSRVARGANERVSAANE